MCYMLLYVYYHLLLLFYVSQLVLVSYNILESEVFSIYIYIHYILIH